MRRLGAKNFYSAPGSAVVTAHPELGARSGDIVAGEFGGTAACMLLNATLPPLWASVAKVMGGALLAYLGAQRASRLGVAMWTGGLRMISSVLEFASYPRELKKLAHDIKTGRLAYLRLHEWSAWSDEPVVFSEGGATQYAPQSVVAAAVTPPEGAPQPVVVKGPVSGGEAGKTNIVQLRAFEV